jgi:hypothetical protein
LVSLEKSRDLSQVNDKLYHIQLYRVYIDRGSELHTPLMIGTYCIDRQKMWRYQSEMNRQYNGQKNKDKIQIMVHKTKHRKQKFSNMNPLKKLGGGGWCKSNSQSCYLLFVFCPCSFGHCIVCSSLIGTFTFFVYLCSKCLSSMECVTLTPCQCILYTTVCDKVYHLLVTDLLISLNYHNGPLQDNWRYN